MGARAPGLLVALLAACAAGPYADFDANCDLHVILRGATLAADTPDLRPVVTAGSTVAHARPVRLPSGGPRAVEIAVLSLRPGRQRVAVWEPALGVDVRVTLDVEGELWAVVDLPQEGQRARLHVYDVPPHDPIGSWRPFVAVPH